MVKIGKHNGITLYMTYEEVANAAKNPNEYKSKLNNQQWAKLRKFIKKHNNGQL